MLNKPNKRRKSSKKPFLKTRILLIMTFCKKFLIRLSGNGILQIRKNRSCNGLHYRQYELVLLRMAKDEFTKIVQNKITKTKKQW